jgi:hypothetical protein
MGIIPEGKKFPHLDPKFPQNEKIFSIMATLKVNKKLNVLTVLPEGRGFCKFFQKKILKTEA